jgi:hypothetical protein
MPTGGQAQHTAQPTAVVGADMVDATLGQAAIAGRFADKPRQP